MTSRTCTQIPLKTISFCPGGRGLLSSGPAPNLMRPSNRAAAGTVVCWGFASGCWWAQTICYPSQWTSPGLFYQLQLLSIYLKLYELGTSIIDILQHIYSRRPNLPGWQASALPYWIRDHKQCLTFSPPIQVVHMLLTHLQPSWTCP